MGLLLSFGKIKDLSSICQWAAIGFPVRGRRGGFIKAFSRIRISPDRQPGDKCRFREKLFLLPGRSGNRRPPDPTLKEKDIFIIVLLFFPATRFSRFRPFPGRGRRTDRSGSILKNFHNLFINL